MPKPKLPDLFASTLEDVTLPSGHGPRLWVRRLIIWSEQGEVVRDIRLRLGLNIIWSPDADEAGNRMGHGGGKTSFCRLLRYCLGEDSFSMIEQRQLIANAMPDAHVGAEIMLDGEQWIVVRPIGNPRGRHFAQKGGVLDSAFGEDMQNSTLSPLREAIAEAIMPEATPHMPVGSSADEAWESALAWMSRDQECRLLDILEWRAPETQSRSPARNMSKDERLVVVRLLINALQPAEIEATRQARAHRQAAADAARRKDRIEWVRNNIGRDLKDVFGGNPEDTASPDLWSRNAGAAVKAEEEKVDPEAETKLNDAREAVNEKQTSIVEAEKRLARIDGELAGLDGQLRTLANIIPKAELRLQDASNPTCDACGQPMTAAAQSFIDERQAEYEELATQQSEVESRKAAFRSEADTLKHQLATDRQELERRQSAFSELQRSTTEAEQRLASARGHVTMTSQYRSYGAEIGRLERQIREEQEAEAGARREARECRRASQNVVQRLSGHFGAIVRFLIPDDAEGHVELAEDGIHPRITRFGNLTSAAVDSLKVVAFDLAVLILTIEGKTQLPGFWLHDSPREADLGLPLYHRLFELARRLEEPLEIPAFQYVITTTTAPPAELQSEPWVPLKLQSSPAGERLFKRNL